jgi:hypothetical protein
MVVRLIPAHPASRITELTMVAFTYDVSTLVGRVRLIAGDTDADGLNRTGGDRTRTDSEIQALLDISDSDPQLAAAALLESKAAEFASYATDITQAGLRQDFRSRSLRLTQAAAVLREGRAATATPLFNEPTRPAPFTVSDGGTMEGW